MLIYIEMLMDCHILDLQNVTSEIASWSTVVPRHDVSVLHIQNRQWIYSATNDIFDGVLAFFSQMIK